MVTDKFIKSDILKYSKARNGTNHLANTIFYHPFFTLSREVENKFEDTETKLVDFDQLTNNCDQSPNDSDKNEDWWNGSEGKVPIQISKIGKFRLRTLKVFIPFVVRFLFDLL